MIKQQSSQINHKKPRSIKILLAEPPNRFPADAQLRPNGSLGPMYIAGALRAAGFEVQFLDATVGLNAHSLKNTFYNKSQPDEKGLVRIGMSEQLIVKVVKNYELIGVTSIFTPQTAEALRFGYIVKQANPNAFLIAGGINAWSMADRFLKAGYDAIGVGEGELLMVKLAKAITQGRNWKGIPGLLYQKNGKVVSSGTPKPPLDINSLPTFAYDLWPLKKYWEISAPHGGDFPPGMIVKYASLETSRGCPFSCSYCHNSTLKENSPAGPIGKLRLKSIDKVMQEVDVLKSLGTEWLFFEDDSLLAIPSRAIEIFKKISDRGLHLADVNGVNLIHFYKRDDHGKMQIRQDLLEAMVEAGFKQLVLPFESGSKRIIDKYASGKWNPETFDVVKLVRAAHKLGLKIPGNFMIGFPDETPEELQQTIDLAKKLVKEGLTYASFFIVVPYPGSKLFTEALKKGYLDPDFDPDFFHWGNPVMKNITIPGEELIRLRKDLWRTINDLEFVKGKVIRQAVPEI